MRDLIKRFVREEEGATMVEYGLMVALIAVVCIAVVAYLGTGVADKFDTAQSYVNGTQAAPSAPSGPQNPVP
jgi:pilus assembly protein Flp/PilA